MSTSKAIIEEEKDGTFYTVIGREDSNGYITVSRGYKGRYFKTRKAAERSTAKYIKKFCL